MDCGIHTSPLLRHPLGWLHTAHLARVVSVNDPESRNRIQVRVMGLDDVARQDAASWARVVCPFAGQNRSAFLVPDVDDEVLVVFQNGDPSYPLVLGGLWNGSSTAPETIGSRGNIKKVIRSKNGVTITLDDSSGQEKFIAQTPGGQMITLSDGPGVVRVADSNGNSTEFASAGVTVVAAATVKVQASLVQVEAGQVTVNSAMSQFSGVVQCQTLIATSVVSGSYTPGAGNVW